MIIWFFISTGLAFAYVFLIFKVYAQWQDQSEWLIPDHFKGRTSISVIIAARNEAANIEQLLVSLSKCASKYDQNLLEIIIVNDHSEDQTAQLIKDFDHPQISVLNLEEAGGKKAAIAKGVSISKGALIITTDADCEVPEEWLNLYASYFEFHQLDFIAAPVLFSEGSRLIEKLQILDLSGMMAVTQAGIRTKEWYMANGANMAFRKTVYESLHGYRDNEQWASGDDMFLIQSVALKDASRVGFVKTKAAVYANSESKIKDFISQRLRWGTKNRAYQHNGVLKTLALVFVFSSCILFNFCMAPFFGSFMILIALFQLLIKWSIDYLFLDRMTGFFEQDKAMKKYILVAPLYLVYIVGIGVASLFVKRYTWKGRQVQ